MKRSMQEPCYNLIIDRSGPHSLGKKKTSGLTDTIKYYSLVRRLGEWMAPDFQKSPSSYEVSLFGFLRCFKFTLSLTELLIITAAPSPPTSHASFTTCFTQSNFTLVHGGSVLSVVHIPNLELINTLYPASQKF